MQSPARARRAPAALLSVLAVLATALVVATPARAAANDLFFSEYVEGSGVNKAIEVYNGTGAPVDLSAYTLELYSNGSTTAVTRKLSGTLADEDVWVGANSGASPAVLAVADDKLSGGVYNWNGDDAIVLRKGGTVVDSIGQVGFRPANPAEWGSGLTSTSDNTLRRKPTVLQGDTNPGDAFDPAAEWDGYAIDTLDGLGAHQAGAGDLAPAVASSTPSPGGADIDLGSAVTVTFTEAVDVAGDWFTIECTGSGAHPAEVSGGPMTYTLDPVTDFAYGDSCTVTVRAAQVTDRDTDDPPNAMRSNHAFTFTTPATAPCEAPITPVYDIQGTTGVSPKAGQKVTTRGVVSANLPGLSGFSLQDPAGDDNEATSDGVFVFVPSGNRFAAAARALKPGDIVTVAATPKEFQGQTELDTVTVLATCGSTEAPSAATVHLPEATDGDLEHYEGMLVTVPETLTVQQNYFLGRYGQLTLGAGGRRYQPTNLFPAGSAPAKALADENARSLVVLDDARSGQNPDPIPFLNGSGTDGTRRAGDTVAGVTGVLDHGAINSNTAIQDFRIQPTEAPVFQDSNPRPAKPGDVGGNIKVASFNVLNFFTDLDENQPGTDFRGANTGEELQRQAAKEYATLAGLDADVVGLLEIENNDAAITYLVDGLNEHLGTPGRWASVPDPVTGVGTDAIKVAMIYRTDRVERVGASLSFPDGAFLGKGRVPVAQTFASRSSGEKLSVVINHFKSKGSCPAAGDPDAAGNTDAGDGQGCWNALRVEEAHALLGFVDDVKAGAHDDDVMVVGDLNAYAEEDPIHALEEGGLVNTIKAHVGRSAYSYVFDGLSGYLDHGLATPSLAAQVHNATEWHIDADEPSVIDYNLEFKPDDRWAATPYRSSDHDPVLVGINLGGNDCEFGNDASSRTRTLLGDCTATSTVPVPDGWTLDGAGHSITAKDPAGAHFTGAVVRNAGAAASVRNLTVTASGLADVCDAGDDRLRGILLDGAAGAITNNRVVDVRQDGSGCQEGNGIEVRNEPFDTTGPDLAVTVSGNEVLGYQKAGIVANGSVLATVTDGPAMSATIGGLAPHGRLMVLGAAGPMEVPPLMLIMGRRA
ncbi:MAG: ExeM/NucH family extracellular endonuclease, partial [Actinomycetes bacterium]